MCAMKYEVHPLLVVYLAVDSVQILNRTNGGIIQITNIPSSLNPSFTLVVLVNIPKMGDIF
jgi:hypothetical protein